MKINFKINFAQKIIEKFDSIKFPNIQNRPLNSLLQTNQTDRIVTSVYNIKTTKWKKQIHNEPYTCRSLQQQMQLLPVDIVAEIANQANNFSEFLLILGITDSQVKQRSEILELSAKQFLKRLNITKIDSSAYEQLLSHIFEYTFKKLSDTEKIDLLNKMRDSGSVYKIQKRVIDFFQNCNYSRLKAMTILASLCGGLVYLSDRVDNWAMQLLEQEEQIIAKQGLPIFLIKAICMTVGSIVFFTITLVCCSIFLQQFVQIVKKNLEESLSKEVENTPENRLKALQLWIYLIQNPQVLLR